MEAQRNHQCKDFQQRGTGPAADALSRGKALSRGRSPSSWQPLGARGVFFPGPFQQRKEQVCPGSACRVSTRGSSLTSHWSKRHVVLWSECLCFPQIPMSKSSPSKKVVARGGAFGRRAGREGAEQLVRVQSLQRPYKRHPEGLPSPLRHHGSTPRRCHCDPERGFSPDPDRAGTSILDFQPPKL
ncbi:uncharacterized protein LOC111741059 isoform X2 [Pteropus vampyrus]|uniref:Uncharacterized protein LOC111741059 isoform X2 n=1 Tax=Pteropus vampyrus TaxID=132908 RepID=A0A6P6CJ66_PTEVA|nr:uncharacterized protein LOC111741059 isoform X2 [Pteropus vampyrus]